MNFHRAKDSGGIGDAGEVGRGHTGGEEREQRATAAQRSSLKQALCHGGEGIPCPQQDGWSGGELISKIIDLRGGRGGSQSASVRATM